MNRPSEHAVAAEGATLWLFVVASVLSFLAGQLFLFSALFDAYAWSHSELVAGLCFVSTVGPLAALRSVTGRLADEYSRLWLVRLSSAGCALAAVALASLPTAWSAPTRTSMLVGLAFAHGLSFSVLPPARYALIGDWFRAERRGTATILSHMASVLALGAGPLLVTLLRRPYGRSIPYLLAVVLLVASVALYGVLARPRNPATTSLTTQRDVHAPLSLDQHTGLWVAALGGALLGPFQVLLPRFVRAQFGVDEANSGLFMSAIGVGLLAGGGAALLLRARLVRPKVALGTLLGSTLSAFAALCSTSSVVAYVAVLSACLVAGATVSAYIARLQEQATDSGRRAFDGNIAPARGLS